MTSSDPPATPPPAAADPHHSGRTAGPEDAQEKDITVSRRIPLLPASNFYQTRGERHRFRDDLWDVPTRYSSPMRLWLPFLVLKWFVTSWRDTVTSRRTRDRVYRGLTNLIARNELHRYKAQARDEHRSNLSLPDDEHVTVSALWAVEIFPPSAANQLTDVVEKYGVVTFFDTADEPDIVVSQTRAGLRDRRSRLLPIINRGSRSQFHGARIGRLPEPFSAVELTMVALGTGLTAVIAQFRYTDAGARALDEEWHRPREPRLRREGPHVIAEDRRASARSHTLEVRRQPHDCARAWMTENITGHFVQAGAVQPVIDLLIVDKADPTAPRPTSIVGEYRNYYDQVEAALRDLGIAFHHGSAMVSAVLPKLVLEPTQFGPHFLTRQRASWETPSWTLWGSRDALAEIHPPSRPDPDVSDALAEDLPWMVSVETEYLITALAISEMVTAMQDQYAKLRDTARRQHDSFSGRDIQKLRRTLLTLSVDLASAAIVVPAWWERNARLVPEFSESFQGAVLLTAEPVLPFTKHLEMQQIKDLALLREADLTTRDILSTVASLGAARDTHNLGIVALAVASLSLIVATITLLVTVPGSDSIFGQIWQWLHE